MPLERVSVQVICIIIHHVKHQEQKLCDEIQVVDIHYTIFCRDRPASTNAKRNISQTYFFGECQGRISGLQGGCWCHWPVIFHQDWSHSKYDYSVHIVTSSKSSEFIYSNFQLENPYLYSTVQKHTNACFFLYFSLCSIPSCRWNLYLNEGLL